MGMTETNQNLIHEDIENKLISNNACHVVLWSSGNSRLLCENVKIEIHLVVDLTTGRTYDHKQNK
jgi:hypothetical protein